MLTIGDLSTKTKVKIPTIRYYEEKGLLPLPERTEGNQRRYTKDSLEQLSFIKHARDLGLPIEQIKELIELKTKPDQSCSEIDAIVIRHLMTIKSKIKKLKQLEKELSRISKSCKGENVKDCNVIRSLADHSLCGGDH
ncbi:MAG: helix-turn-helix domain-containing protein [Rhizobiales bacterium]|nr:helix-turn-helix domain-containing protein [Hyphomicrobiales bacterium]